MKLLYNHMTLDLAENFFFEFVTEPFKRLLSRLNRDILEEVAQSGLPGLIFTYM